MPFSKTMHNALPSGVRTSDTYTWFLPEPDNIEEALVTLIVSNVGTAGTLNCKVEVYNPYDGQWYDHLDGIFQQVTSATGTQSRRVKTFGMRTRVVLTIAGTNAAYTCQVIVNAKTFENLGKSWQLMGLIPKARRTSTYTSGNIEFSNLGFLGLFLEVAAINVTSTLNVKIEDVLTHTSPNTVVSNYAFSEVTSGTCRRFKPVDCQSYYMKATGTISGSGDYTYGMYGITR